MLCNPHQFYMGVAHLLHVGGQLGGSFLIGIIAVLFRAVFLFPGAQVYLIDAHGRFARVGVFTFLYPGAIRPAERVVEGSNGCRARPVFGVLGKRVSLKNDLAGLGSDGKFIKLARFDAGNKALVNAGGFQHLHRAGIGIPVIKVTYYADRCSVWSPYRKIIAVFAIEGFRVGAEFVVDLIVGTFSEQVTVTGGDKAGLGLLFLISDCHKVNPP